MKRILLVTGHYGSGKTEFSVSLAAIAAKNNSFGFERTAVADLDVVNPYFRSRERADMLGKLGVTVYGSFFGGSVTAEIPEISPAVRTPLEDGSVFTIVDVGGNEAGARIIRQFGKYFTPEASALLVIVNASRFETRTADGALIHLRAIESELGIKPAGIVNNTHLLRETTASDVIRGHELCADVSRMSGIPLVCDCYPAPLVNEAELSALPGPFIPLGMYMRESWLDK